MKYITPISTIAILVAVFVCVPYLMDRAERADCYKWQEQAQVYPSFYLTDWQEAQCDYHQISVSLDQ
tara:strand:+ start:1235 stop:1435 length:201 start_codon:yes stop_codon:yes gene_type:complete